MADKRVLFLTAPIGAGHVKAAEAVNESIKSQNPGIKTQLCSVFDFFPKFLGQSILSTYLKILEVFPEAYGAAYGWGNASKLALWGRDLVSEWLGKRMLNYIEEYKPTLIVCTHATPAGLISWLKRKKALSVPAVAVITDFVVHRLWVYPEIDHYFVAHTEMLEYIKQQDISSDKVSVTGIPISAKFRQRINKQEILDKIGFTGDRKTILIMGGGAGILPIYKLLRVCSEVRAPLQIIAVAGKNTALYRKIVKMESSANYPLKVFGYVDNVHELMAAADLIISKPGGVSTAESLASEVPLLIYRPIPGQEAANTRFLLDKEAALLATSENHLAQLLGDILRDNERLDAIRVRAARLGNSDAADAIVSVINKKYFDFN